MDQTPGMTPKRLTRPHVGRSPTRPHQVAGKRTEPPVSSPKDAAHIKAAVAAPEPLLEPPVNRSKSQGLRAVSNAWDIPVVANSVMFSLPKSTAPADLRLVSTVASSLGITSLNMGEPPVVRIPAE